MADTGVQKNIRMDAAARREQILNTACGLFYEYGYDGVKGCGLSGAPAGVGGQYDGTGRV